MNLSLWCILVNNYPRWNITFPFLDSACKQAQEKSFWSCSLNFVPLLRGLKKVTNSSDLGCRRRGGGGEFLSSAVFFAGFPPSIGPEKGKVKKAQDLPIFSVFKKFAVKHSSFCPFFSLTQIQCFSIFTHSCARGGNAIFPALDAGGRLDAASDEERQWLRPHQKKKRRRRRRAFHQVEKEEERRRGCLEA